MAPLPPPTSVETYRLPSGPWTALRSRTPFARIGVAKDTSPLPSRNITRALASFRKATASAPSQDFHCDPVRKVPPDGATVPLSPERQAGIIASGNFCRAVLGRGSDPAITGRHPQLAVRAEANPAAVVEVRLGPTTCEDRCPVLAVERRVHVEAHDSVVAGGRVARVHEVVRREVRVDGEAQHAGLAAGGDVGGRD